jgi:hypothetical protein
MPRRCTVCDHPERRSIDEALVTGAPYRSVAKRFGLSESAVYRHKTEHLPVHLLKAREVEEVAQAKDMRELAEKLRKGSRNGYAESDANEVAARRALQHAERRVAALVEAGRMVENEIAALVGAEAPKWAEECREREAAARFRLESAAT